MMDREEERKEGISRLEERRPAEQEWAGDPLAASRLSFFPFAFSRAQSIDGNRVSG